MSPLLDNILLFILVYSQSQLAGRSFSPVSLLASKLPVDSFTMLGTDTRDSIGLGGSVTALSTEPVVFPSGNRILQHETLMMCFCKSRN